MQGVTMRWWGEGCLRCFFSSPQNAWAVRAMLLLGFPLSLVREFKHGGWKRKSHDATVRVFLSRVRNLVAVAVEVVAAPGQNAGARPATESKRADSRSLSAPASTATADLDGLGGWTVWSIKALLYKVNLIHNWFIMYNQTNVSQIILELGNKGSNTSSLITKISNKVTHSLHFQSLFPPSKSSYVIEMQWLVRGY